MVAFVQYFLSISMFLNLSVRFAVREKYPLDRAHQREGPPSAEKLYSILSAAKPGDGLKKILIPHVGMYITWMFMTHISQTASFAILVCVRQHSLICL